MVIQFDTAHNVKASEEVKAPLIEILNEKLHQFNGQITRLEVHLSDEDGGKDGENDKRCLLEAHLNGKPHTVVTNHANTYKQAVDGAGEKLKSSLNSLFGRLQNGHKRDSKEI